MTDKINKTEQLFVRTEADVAELLQLQAYKYHVTRSALLYDKVTGDIHTRMLRTSKPYHKVVREMIQELKGGVK